MDGQQESDSAGEQSASKRPSADREGNGDERTLNDIIVLYDYEGEQNNDEYDMALDGFLIDSCSQYLFKFTIIVLPIIFLIVIVVGLYENNAQNSELRCKIGRAFIVLGVSVGLLIFYLLIRYGLHIRSLYRENNRQESQRDSSNSDNEVNNILKRNKMSKKQLKFILQNPWHRGTDSDPKEQYTNHVDIYKENGLYNTSNNIV